MPLWAREAGPQGHPPGDHSADDYNRAREAGPIVIINRMQRAETIRKESAHLAAVADYVDALTREYAKSGGNRTESYDVDLNGIGALLGACDKCSDIVDHVEIGEECRIKQRHHMGNYTTAGKTVKVTFK